MGAPSKRAKRIRKASEFDLNRLISELLPPKETSGAYAWSLAEIKAARDDQMRGRFRKAAQLAASSRTDDAVFVAHENRLAPQRSLPVVMAPGKGARAEGVANEADALYGANGVAIHPDSLNDINAHLADHGVAFAAGTAVPRDDGSRVDIFVRSWPIEFVRWDVTDQCFKTQTRDGAEERIVHGDGRWVVFQKHEIEPWKHGCILAIALVWARHAFGQRDWAKGSTAHAAAKLVGELPTGIPLQVDGTLSKDALAFLDLLRALMHSDSPIGIRPAGSKTDFASNASSAWQVWKELIEDAKKAAARIYLGTDGVLGAGGGAPGVDITALFGVASTIVEGDLRCIERGLRTGVLEPWCALNFGDSTLTPTRKYVFPDGDEAAEHDARAKREAAFFATIKAAREAGFEITQAYVDTLAERYDIDAPRLASAPPANGAPPAATAA